MWGIMSRCVGRDVRNVLGWGEVRRKVGKCWKRSRECERVWGEVRCGEC